MAILCIKRFDQPEARRYRNPGGEWQVLREITPGQVELSEHGKATRSWLDTWLKCFRHSRKRLFFGDDHRGITTPAGCLPMVVAKDDLSLPHAFWYTPYIAGTPWLRHRIAPYIE